MIQEQADESVQQGVRRVPYDVVIILKLCFLLCHCAEDSLKGVDQVAENDNTPLLPFVLAETVRVYNSHLLEHCRLSTFTSTCANQPVQRGSRELGRCSPSSSNFTSLSCFFLSARSAFSISSFLRDSGSSGFFPKHIIAMYAGSASRKRNWRGNVLELRTKARKILRQSVDSVDGTFRTGLLVSPTRMSVIVMNERLLSANEQ